MNALNEGASHKIGRQPRQFQSPNPAKTTAKTLPNIAQSVEYRRQVPRKISATVNSHTSVSLARIFSVLHHTDWQQNGDTTHQHIFWPHHHFLHSSWHSYFGFREPGFEMFRLGDNVVTYISSIPSPRHPDQRRNRTPRPPTSVTHIVIRYLLRILRQHEQSRPCSMDQKVFLVNCLPLGQRTLFQYSTTRPRCSCSASIISKHCACTAIYSEGE